MANTILALGLIGAALLWRRVGFWLPAALAVSLRSRQRALFTAGCAIVVLGAAYSIGDIVSGRTQIARRPVVYATRLTGADAHHHDLADPTRFWGQVALQCAGALAVGGALMLLGGREARAISRTVA